MTDLGSKSDTNGLTDALVAEAYEHLRQLAAGIQRRHQGQSIRPTSLVHDVYERLANNPDLVVHDRAHLMAIAAQAMRYALADRARRQRSAKRGGGWQQVSLTGIASDDATVHIVALDEALSALTNMDPQTGRIVELRFLGGLDVSEIATLLDVSERTVRRKWRAGQAWLKVQL